MSDVTVLTIDTIISNPKVRSGRPIIAGTTLRVQDVAAHHRYRQYTPDELAYQLQITLAQVHAALAYYYAHKDELDAQMEEDDRLIREAKEQGIGQRDPSLLR
ncbi:MAG: DUF433 domain-containing protein [Chloroflexota bacterium]|nr:DUF433 domain-containing protein [Chloroflexota bacterium]